MAQHKRLLTAALIGLASFSFTVSAHSLGKMQSSPQAVAERAQSVHGLQAWWGKEVVSADVEIIFGGKKAVEGTFTFEAHGPRARYDRKDGVSIIFDGKMAWVTPGDVEAPMGRFHVLTWPWFIMAPFKMQGDGITLSDLQENEVNGTHYHSVLQAFASDMGDSPDDWYRFYVNADTGVIDAMSYIVTYGKDAEKANETPSIIKYLDYEKVDGPVISTRYELWYWDAEGHAYVGDAPKASGTVTNIKYSTSTEADFSVPEGATELPLK